MTILKRGTPLEETERKDLIRLIDEEGIVALRKETGLSRTAILSAAVGQPVIAGTRKLLRDLLEDEHDEMDEQDDEHDDDEVDDSDRDDE